MERTYRAGPRRGQVRVRGIGKSVQAAVDPLCRAGQVTPVAYYTGQLNSSTYTPLATIPASTRTTKTDNQFDALGRVVKAEDLGDTAVSGDERCTVTTYVDNAAAGILDAPAEVNTYAGTCAALPSTPATATISDVRSSYDSHAWGAAPSLGDVTQTQQASAFTGTIPTWLTTATDIVDALGRTLSSTDALSRQSQTAYTPAAPAAGGTFTGNVGPVTQVLRTDPMSLTATDVINPAWDSVASETDVNSHVSTIEYDALGRKVGVWAPDRPQASNPIPSTGFAYTIIAGQPMSVATTTLTPTGATRTSFNIYDGLLRLRQTQAPAEAAVYNAPPGSAGSSVTDTFYTYAGQIATVYHAYPTPTSVAPSGTIWPAVFGNVPSSTSTLYDGAGRTTASITNAYGLEQWRTSTAYPGTDRIDVAPPAGGTATTTFTDARGHTTDLLQYHGSTIGDPAVPSGYDKTHYTYLSTGLVQNVTNAAGEQWNWSYDTLGRVTAAVDPDTGTTTSSYDNGNQLQSSTNAAATLWYSYDNDARKTAVNQGTAAGPLLDSWTYDTLTGAKGLLTSGTSYVGSVPGTPGVAYTTAVTGYDTAGRPLGATTTLPAGTLGTGSAAYSYTTSATYNPDGSLATQSEPMVGGVPFDHLAYTYTSLGRLYSLIGAKPYLTGTSYDGATGLVTGQQRANSSYSLNDVYTYTPGTLRLATVQTTTSASSNNLAANLSYTYNNAGEITSTTNAPSVTAPDIQCFSYDTSQRLQQAWTPTTNNCTTAPSSSSLGGPAPYWQSYTIATDGNRLSILNHATTVTGTDLKDTYSYPTGTNPAQPHAVTTITHATAPAGTTSYTTTGTDTYGYNTTGQTTITPTQTLTWTPQGQLATVKQGASGPTQTRIYDTSGNLLVQTDPTNGTIAYLGDTELKVAAGSTTITAQRVYSANGHPVAVRNGSATLAWLDTDPQGTSQLSETMNTGTTTTRYNDPYGNPRGTTTAFPEDRGYLNAPKDPFSSLTHLGAREYNAATGRFLSVDPMLDPADPQQMNGYAYASNNPITSSDPSGLRTIGEGGSDACTPDCGPTAGGTQPPVGASGGGSGGSGTGGGGGSGTGGGCQSDAQCSRTSSIVLPKFPTTEGGIAAVFAGQCGQDLICERQHAVNGCTVLLGNRGVCANMSNTTDDIISMIYNHLYEQGPVTRWSGGGWGLVLGAISALTGVAATVSALVGAEPLAAGLGIVSLSTGSTGTIIDCSNKRDAQCGFDVTSTALSLASAGIGRFAAQAGKLVPSAANAFRAAESVAFVAARTPSVSSPLELLAKVFDIYGTGFGLPGTALGIANQVQGGG